MVRTPNIIGDTWLNSKPLTKEDLENNVVLVDFFTYSCVNCERTTPYLQQWWEKYQDKGLIIIGIHTPEFDFEKNPEYVAQALRDQGITWPVVLDNDKVNWDAFANRAWPAKYLIDKNGYIAYQHLGEGAYEETENQIIKLLNSNDSIKPADIDLDEHIHGKVCFIATPETYCGYNRGKLYDQNYKEDETILYKPVPNLPLNNMMLKGEFFASGEYIEFKNEGSELILHFTATEVNLVLHPGTNKALLHIKFNGENVEVDMKGHDVTEGGEVVVTKPRLYNLIKSNELLDGTLTVRSVEGTPQAYAFTFSGCPE